MNMTQLFREDGTVVPVTLVKAGPCVVTQVKTADKDGVNAIQIGFGAQKAFRLNKAMQGHLKGIDPVMHLRDVQTGDQDHGLHRGDKFSVGIFAEGDKVQVIGQSKGKGFQGVVKRHGFAGSPASHGHKDQLRMPGSIGATDAARVFKGTRMGGHMGDEQVTVKNLEIIKVDEENNELYIKGALPGARNGLLIISTNEGTIEVMAAPAQETAETAPVEDTPAQEPKEEATAKVEAEQAEETKAADASESKEESAA